VQSSLVDGTHPQYLVWNATYTPFGALATLTNGCVGTGQNQGCTQVQESYDYNNRLQVVRIRLGTAANPAANYCLVYNYYYPSVGTPTSCTLPAQAAQNDDGLVDGYLYQDQVNPSLSHSTQFLYDVLKRLGTAVATGSSTYNFGFSYDATGT